MFTDVLTALIEAAEEHRISFVYALSPGLDMTYSSPIELCCLKRKLSQVASFGCHAFALLFDDIEADMCEADKSVYQSFAFAQVSLYFHSIFLTWKIGSQTFSFLCQKNALVITKSFAFAQIIHGVYRDLAFSALEKCF